jgi:glycerate 2-kinase
MLRHACISSHWSAENACAMHGGVVVTHDAAAAAQSPLKTVVGDHPIPGRGSQHAADALAAYLASDVRRGDHVLVLLSGGTSALIGAPISSVSREDFLAVQRTLLHAGLRIDDMNHIRRQLSRWGGGRLGASILACGATAQVLVVSDVIGDDLRAIGSGPCLPDDAPDSAHAAALLAAAAVPDTDARALVERVLRATGVSAASAPAETVAIPHEIIGSNATALITIAHLAAVDLGATVVVSASPLRADAHACGAQIARELLALANEPRDAATRGVPQLMCWGGEPVLALPPQDVPPGGRMQALAMSAARGLNELAPNSATVTLLAAGTDGRDGTTDTSGAVVDHTTWGAITRAGRSPEQDLQAFRSHEALRAVGALLPAFASGTNVNDVVVGMVTRR